MKLLCIGDSNTYGYDPRSYMGSRYPEGVRWTSLLKGFELINLGVNGLTVPREASAFIDIIRKNGPDVTIIMLGSNDLLEGEGALQTCGRMDRFIESIEKAAKGILLIAPPRFQYGEWVQSAELIEESRKLGALYRELAEEKGCHFADSGDWGIDILFDGVHFSPAGHETFARRLGELLGSSAMRTDST